MDVYFRFIEKGILVPFHPVNAGDTSIFIETDKGSFEVPDGYKKIFQYDDFYIQVGEKGIVTITSFGHLEYGGTSIAAGETSRSSLTYDGKETWSAIDFHLPKGEYQFSMTALEKTTKTPDEVKYNQGYAYGFFMLYSCIIDFNINIDKQEFKEYVMNIGLINIFEEGRCDRGSGK